MDHVTGTNNTGWQEAFGSPFGDSSPFQEEATAGTSPFQMDTATGNMPFSEEDFYAAEEMCREEITASQDAITCEASESEDTDKAEGTEAENLEETGSEDEAEADKAKAEEKEEERRRAEHEAAEAKRKAEWEARQQEKKAAEQKEMERLESMTDEEVMSASMQRVSRDTEKLTRRNMKDCVSEHIQTLCLDDSAFARLALHPRKNMINCFRYINRKAREFVEQEMKDNDIKPESGVYGSNVPDDLCYQWAEDYFRDPDAKEDQPEQEEKFVPKPYTGKSVSKAKAKKAAEKKKPVKIAEEKKPAANAKKETAEQLTLDAFLIPEEAAS